MKLMHIYVQAQIYGVAYTNNNPWPREMCRGVVLTTSVMDNRCLAIFLCYIFLCYIGCLQQIRDLHRSLSNKGGNEAMK